MIGAALILLAGQAASKPVPTPVPERFSVLASPCPTPEPGKDVVVCGDRGSGPRLPLPAERGPPNHGVPVNPKLDGAGALAAAGTPCAATQWGCTVGFGPPIMPVVSAVAGLVKSALAKKPDKTGRVAIALDTPPPQTAGRVLP